MPLELGSSASMWSLAIRLAAGQSMLQHQGISATLRVGLFDMNVVCIYILSLVVAFSCCVELRLVYTGITHRHTGCLTPGRRSNFDAYSRPANACGLRTLTVIRYRFDLDLDFD
ncbi:hypothetical protein SORBI_3005G085100 [Sorghum bicolor]|uniref:Uncharacterized protein n=1 Tax=Sorghum bicolor TaxID=4558 RepID=A0A1B6PR14_SORBI|nr:hypothetical protein SORBI_3005G085100 [Sorghum bicolor]